MQVADKITIEKNTRPNRIVQTQKRSIYEINLKINRYSQHHHQSHSLISPSRTKKQRYYLQTIRHHHQSITHQIDQQRSL